MTHGRILSSRVHNRYEYTYVNILINEFECNMNTYTTMNLRELDMYLFLFGWQVQGGRERD